MSRYIRFLNPLDPAKPTEGRIYYLSMKDPADPQGNKTRQITITPGAEALISEDELDALEGNEVAQSILAKLQVVAPDAPPPEPVEPAKVKGAKVDA